MTERAASVDPIAPPMAASPTPAAPRLPWRRHRAVGFVSAVVLFVLLAAAGLPLGGTVACAQHIEAGDRAVEHVVRRAARGEPDVVEPSRGGAVARPRPVSRQRCIAACGLPPARAPCA